MKTFAYLSASIVMGLTLVGPVSAAPTPDASPMAPRSGDAEPAERPSASDAIENPRVVTGRVLNVDAGAGTIVIQTPLGVIALRGPSEDLRLVRVGDVVEVEMVGDEDYPSASPPMEPGSRH